MVQLLGGIGAVFIEKAVFFFPDLRQLYWLVIGKPFEAVAVKCPFPVFGRQLFNGLCHDERPFSHVIELTVAFRAQSCITAVDKFRVAEFLKDCFLQWFKGLLLVLVSRENGEGQGYPVPVREQPHLYDGVRAVLLALPILFCPVFLLDFEVIVRAVVIKDAVILVCQEAAVLEGLRLYEAAFLCKDIQGTVDVMLFIGRFFEIVHCRPVRGSLASRFQYPGVYQVRQDGIEVIPELMPFPDLPAGPVKSEPIIDRL